MNLPNYFLADLPSEAGLTPIMIAEACRTLRRNRELYLANRTTQSLINVLSALGQNWLQPDYPFRKLALEHCPAATGFPRAVLASGLDSFFRQLTRENLRALLIQELGHPGLLDELTYAGGDPASRRAALARGPELLIHIAAGNIPNPLFTSMVLGLLVRSAQFVKCASGMSLLPRLFAHSLYETEPKLGACLEIAEWPGGNVTLEKVLFGEADCVTATGSDETLAAIRRRLPFSTRFLGYGHRLSFGYVTRNALAGGGAENVVTRAAADVVAWNQLGCLSPHVIYVEQSGSLPAAQFAARLAEELARRELSQPRGQLPPELAAAIASRRAVYELRAAHSEETRLWQSSNSTAWTVVYEADPQFQVSCLNRFVYVKGVANLSEALQAAASVRGKISTVGLAASPDEARDLVTQLARWGVPRVCPLGQMQNPPLTWRHDGRPSLGDLVTWTDWEQD